MGLAQFTWHPTLNNTDAASCDICITLYELQYKRTYNGTPSVLPLRNGPCFIIAHRFECFGRNYLANVPDFWTAIRCISSLLIRQRFQNIKEIVRGVPFRNQTWRTAEKVAFSDVTLTPWHELGTLNGSGSVFQIPAICVAALQQL